VQTAIYHQKHLVQNAQNKASLFTTTTLLMGLNCCTSIHKQLRTAEAGWLDDYLLVQ
jgi:hypothetical protein